MIEKFHDGLHEVHGLFFFFFQREKNIEQTVSPAISPEQNGSYVIPWGRVRSDKDCPRKDIIKAMAPTEDGGMGHDTKFWEWCEQQWKPFV